MLNRVEYPRKYLTSIMRICRYSTAIENIYVFDFIRLFKGNMCGYSTTYKEIVDILFNRGSIFNKLEQKNEGKI